MISVVICIVIFVFSSHNGTLSGRVSEGVTRKLFPEILSDDVVFALEKFLRKAAHYGIYLILGISVYFSVTVYDKAYSDGKSNTVSCGLISVFLCFVYSLTDEFHQSFIPGRNGAFSDCILDTFGAFTGIAVVILLSALIKKTAK